MATQRDVRRIALSLPDVTECGDRFAFEASAGGKTQSIAWVWLERVDPKKARVPNPTCLAVRVAGLDERQVLLDASPEKFFTEPHYRNYPAVLVRLPAVRTAELRALLEEAWRVATTPKKRAPRKAAAKPPRARPAR